MTALPTVTWTRGSAQKGRCPYITAFSFVPKSHLTPVYIIMGVYIEAHPVHMGAYLEPRPPSNPRGYSGHSGQHRKGPEQRSVDNCPAHRLGPVDGLRYGSSPPRQILSL